MEFIETAIFTKRIQELLQDDDYRDLQSALTENPKAGDPIPGGHGLRKIRWRSPIKGSGKRGGIRVIYYRISSKTIYMIFAYDKTTQKNLTKQQLKVLMKRARLEPESASRL